MSQIVEAGVAPNLVASEREGLLAWVASVDHKQIGILYMISSMFFFLVGGIEALVIRLQLIAPGLHLISPETFDQMFTMHGTTMIFLFVMPMLTGFSTYVIPLMIGARDMAFPRLNAVSFWIQLFGGVILYFSFLAGGAPNAGWFSYTPLSEKAYSSLAGVDYWIIGLACIGIGTLAAAINFAVTIICLRVPGLTIRRLPLFVWMTLVNSFLMIGALPLINAALAMLLIDRFFNAHVFDPAWGGSALLWQHYFWSFGHPEVYIMILPAFGIISEVIPVFSRKPIFGYEFVAASSVAIAFLSFTVWAHHMFTVGMSHIANLAFGFASMLIAVPTGIKIFNWTATMYGGRIRFTTAMMFAVAFLITFTIGGLSGISFAVFPLDWQLTDTYYLVAHFHYVLFGGSVFGIFAGFYYWFPKFSGRMMSERLGRVELLAGLHRLQHDVPHPAHPRARGHAAPSLHLSRFARMGRDESDLDARRVHARHLGAGVHVEHLREPRRWRGGRRQSVGRMDAGMGDDLAAAAGELRSRAACAWTPPAVGPRASGPRG